MPKELVSTSRPRLVCPHAILFDWHATLANTFDAMYHALDEVLPKLKTLDLLDQLVAPGQSKTPEDEKLVNYVRETGHLHPRIRAERKVSRTDIFEVLFGNNQAAKSIAHRAFDDSYARHFGIVHPMEPQARTQLLALREMGIPLGVLTNRRRQFMAHEVYTIDGSGWHELFATIVCGDDGARRKPQPDQIHRALTELALPADAACWFVGDSTTDVIAAKRAGVTAVFYNGAGWDQAWIDKIFPGTPRHPEQPDLVVCSLPELLDQVRRLQR
ncbi:HAD family hydrolase [Sinimarinibacterium sp. CAU 1509]|uniref:HAD family hydrolase n=1 Tax=Sinimarinibacterium sp. CAU 1509 TaxID=2562283 RepID=UPI0010ACF113|nr:HAD-IA family hydrolase [Sinimarinibacterium sp. CAU 1509]TJY64773.1 HAD family hydrolase [Sinimarinibacterium sp. CAU 1509]